MTKEAPEFSAVMTTAEQVAISQRVQEEAKQRAAVRHLTSGSLLARNTVWNLIGQFAPMVVAVLVIPRLIRGLGTDRFGVLTIAWTLVGYFGLFDFGLGRALTNLVAQATASDDDESVAALIWTGNAMMLLLGSVGALAFASASPWLVTTALRIPPNLQEEVLRSFYVLSASIPFAVSSTGLRGVLEAKHRFAATNAVRVPMGIAVFLGPLCVLPFSRGLIAVMGVLTVVRITFWLVFLLLIMHDPSVGGRGVHFLRESILPLLGFGGWMTVSNIISPVMMYLDRFLIGALLSLAAVTYYATPYEVSTKLLIVPAGIVGVLFPAFSAALVRDHDRAVKLFRRGVTYISVILAPIVFAVLVFARDGLMLWVGADFASRSTLVLQWITVGVLANSVAQIPFAFVQGAKRPDLTGKLHLAELAVYVPMVLVLTHRFGIVGTAAAWTLRVTADAVCLLLLASRIVNRPLWKQTWFAAMLALQIFAFPLSLAGVAVRVVGTIFVLAVLAYVTWTRAISVQDRTSLLRCFHPAEELRSLVG